MTNFGDHAHDIRAEFIRSSESLEAKRAALRERLHSEKRALVGEEAEAKKNGWAVFKPQRGWVGK